MAKDEENQVHGQSGGNPPGGGNHGPGRDGGPGVDHGQAGDGQGHKVKIIVNGKEKPWAKEKISYDELVTLSGEPLPTGPDPGFTITYFNGPKDRPEGTLMKDNSIKVVDGMVFNVTPTNRS